jgi:glucan phosphoethanolaminetransferase (alkaline phosphatase superfamily)
MRVLLKAVDTVANLLALLAFIFLIVAVVWWGVSGTFQYLRSMWDAEDRILLIMVGAGVVWRVFRWNDWSKPPQDATVSKWKLRNHRKRKRYSSAPSG